MEVIHLIAISTLIFFVILYFVVKAAVRNGIIEAQNINDTPPYNAYSDENRIAQTTCPNCNKKYDCDFPKCPYCKF